MAPGLDRRAETRAPKWLFTRALKNLDKVLDVIKVRLDRVTVAQIAEWAPHNLFGLGWNPASGSYETDSKCTEFTVHT